MAFFVCQTSGLQNVRNCDFYDQPLILKIYFKFSMFNIKVIISISQNSINLHYLERGHQLALQQMYHQQEKPDKLLQQKQNQIWISLLLVKALVRRM